MRKYIETIFTTQATSGGIEGRLGIDKEARLYWNEQPIVTEQEVRLQWWVNFSIIVASLSTLVIAIFAGLQFFNCAPK